MTPIAIFTMLVNSGIPADDAARLICIASYESNYIETAISPINSNGTQDFGVFQINSSWSKKCAGGKNSKLLKNEVNIGCAIYIYNEQGLEAWSTYKYCK